MANENIDNLEIDIKVDDNNIDPVEFFIEKLEEQYEEFNQKMKNEREKARFIFENEKINKTIKFLPDCYRFESPTTLLNGDWGVGKTHFIYLMCKYISDCANNNKSWSNLFEKLIVIDCLEFINSKDIVKDIIKRIYFLFVDPMRRYGLNLIDFMTKTIVRWVGFEGFYENVIQTSNQKSCFQNKELETTIRNQKRKFKNKTSEEQKATLIFIDNVERLDHKAYEVITALYELAKIQGMYIIFVAEKETLYSLVNESTTNVNKKKQFIEKFITTRKFNLTVNRRTIIENELKNYPEYSLFANEFFSNDNINKLFQNHFWSNRILIKQTNYDKWIQFFNFDLTSYIDEEQDTLLLRSLIRFYFFKKLLQEKVVNYRSALRSILTSSNNLLIKNDEQLNNKINNVYSKLINFLFNIHNLDKIWRNFYSSIPLRKIYNFFVYFNNINLSKESFWIGTITTVWEQFINLKNDFKRLFPYTFKVNNDFNDFDFNKFISGSYDAKKENDYINWFFTTLEEYLFELFKLLYPINKNIYDVIKNNNPNIFNNYFDNKFSFYDDKKLDELEHKLSFLFR